KEHVNQAKDYAKRATELDKETKIFDISHVIEATKYAEEIADLELKIVEYAKIVAESAEVRAIELENNAEEHPIDNTSGSIKDEKIAFESEKALIWPYTRRRRRIYHALPEIRCNT